MAGLGGRVKTFPPDWPGGEIAGSWLIRAAGRFPRRWAHNSSDGDVAQLGEHDAGSVADAPRRPIDRKDKENSVDHLRVGQPVGELVQGLGEYVSDVLNFHLVIDQFVQFPYGAFHRGVDALFELDGALLTEKRMIPVPLAHSGLLGLKGDGANLRMARFLYGIYRKGKEKLEFRVPVAGFPIWGVDFNHSPAPAPFALWRS